MSCMKYMAGVLVILGHRRSKEFVVTVFTEVIECITHQCLAQ